MMLLPHPIAIAIGLIVVGVMAVAARLMKMSEQMRVALIAPQQIVLLIQFIGISVAAWNGAYPDGYVPVPGNWQASFWFILGDQAALLVLCLSHTFEFVTLKAFRLPTPAQYEAKLAKKNAVTAALRQERDDLELRVKERTERLNMLNVELHHRFKNLLSVVSAMARQSGADQRFSDVFDKRPRGLAATLDLLTEKHWQGIRIRELLKAQLGDHTPLGFPRAGRCIRGRDLRIEKALPNSGRDFSLSLTSEWPRDSFQAISGKAVRRSMEEIEFFK
jgi:hypothetical protein